MIDRLLSLAEDALAFFATMIGVLLVFHMVDRIAFGLSLNGVLN